MPELFGGAIVCDFPPSYEDVSILRDIPDSEEVFQEAATDSSIIIELVEYQDGVEDEDIATFHFNNIAEINQVRSSRVEETTKIQRPGEAFRHFICCSGVQTGVIKFREQDPIGNDISVWLAVARMKSLNLELVVSVSAPISISQTSSSHTLGSVPNVQLGKQVFERIVATLCILDYGLFA
jgi:hypothetical protein